MAELKSLGAPFWTHSYPSGLIDSAGGGGNHNLDTFRDGLSGSGQPEFDSYDSDHGSRTSDYFGYLFPTNVTMTGLTWDAGPVFADGGFYTGTPTVEVRVSGTWTAASGVSWTPSYGGSGAGSYASYAITFSSVSADGVRIIGTPGGAATFISISELGVTGTAGITDLTPGSTPSSAFPPNGGVSVSTLIDMAATTWLDTYDGGGPRSLPDIFTLTFSGAQNCNCVMFAAGKTFGDGGYWAGTPDIEAHVSGSWTAVTSVTWDPSYAANSYDQSWRYYIIKFDTVSCDAIRIGGVAGGSAHFMSASEFRAYYIGAGATAVQSSWKNPTRQLVDGFYPHLRMNERSFRRAQKFLQRQKRAYGFAASP